MREGGPRGEAGMARQKRHLSQRGRATAEALQAFSSGAATEEHHLHLISVYVQIAHRSTQPRAEEVGNATPHPRGSTSPRSQPAPAIKCQLNPLNHPQLPGLLALLAHTAGAGAGAVGFVARRANQKLAELAARLAVCEQRTEAKEAHTCSPWYAAVLRRQDFVAEAGVSRKSVGQWELFVGT
jgi:hypothetical protein